MIFISQFLVGRVGPRRAGPLGVEAAWEQAGWRGQVHVKISWQFSVETIDHLVFILLVLC